MYGKYVSHRSMTLDFEKIVYLQDIPPGAYPPNSPYSKYDGRYIYDHDAVPPRPPLPSSLDNSGYSCDIIKHTEQRHVFFH